MLYGQGRQEGRERARGDSQPSKEDCTAGKDHPYFLLTFCPHPYLTAPRLITSLPNFSAAGNIKARAEKLKDAPFASIHTYPPKKQPGPWGPTGRMGRE